MNTLRNQWSATRGETRVETHIPVMTQFFTMKMQRVGRAIGALVVAALGALAGAQVPIDAPRVGGQMLPHGAPQGRNRPGPWDGDAWLYESTDGLRFTKVKKLVERAGVPTLIADKRGRLIALFQWFPQHDDRAFDRVVVCLSEDAGRTWSAPRTIAVEEFPNTLMRPFDPTIVLLEDGRFRLYFTSVAGKRGGPATKESPPGIYSAISDDAVTWRFEPGMRFGVDREFVIDCAAARLGSTWHLYSPVQRKDGYAYHAVSTDGLKFERREDVKLAMEGTWLGCAVNIGEKLRFYGSGMRGGWSATSSDGATWTLDGGTSPGGGSDPGVAATADGRWLMVATRPGELRPGGGRAGGDRKAYLEYMRDYDSAKAPKHACKTYETPKSVTMGRLTRVGHGGFPRLLHVGGRLHVFLSVGDRSWVVRLDGELKPDGFEKQLKPPETRWVDHDLTAAGDFVYHYAMLPGGAGQVRKYDKDFNLVAETEVFHTSGTDMILDQNIEVIQGKVYAAGEYRENGPWRSPRSGEQNIPPDPKQARGIHLRIFDLNLKPIGEENLTADIPGAAVRNQFWGLGTSQFEAGGYHCLAVHTPIGNVAKFALGESVGARQIFVLRYDAKLRFVDAKGPLSDTDRDNFWCTGSCTDGERTYIVYASVTRGYIPGPGEQAESRAEANVRLGIFDENFEEIETIDLTKRGDGGMWPDVLKVGNRLYAAYVSETERGVVVREIIPR
ncbi:MAG: sialidase family protein [Verrucomicrobiota bacterium]